MNKRESQESDRTLLADWRIHFPAALAKSPDLQAQAIATLRGYLPPATKALLPDLITVGVNPAWTDGESAPALIWVTHDDEPPIALWLTYGNEPALLAHECYSNHRALVMRIWEGLTGLTETVMWGSDGKWLATFDPAPNGRYVMFSLGGG